jgi:hypothetical protein
MVTIKVGPSPRPTFEGSPRRPTWEPDAAPESVGTCASSGAALLCELPHHAELRKCLDGAIATPTAPWSAREPGAGSPSVVALQPQFLSPTLVPTSIGGEANDTESFPQGSWMITSGVPLGITPALRQPRLG